MPIRWSVIFAVALLAAGCGATTAGAPARHGTESGSSERGAAVRAASGPSRARTEPGGRAERTPPRGRKAGARPRLPAGRTVRGAIDRALLAGRIDRAAARSYRRTEARARAALRRLGGVRRAELATVLATLDAVAASGALTSDRLPAALLTLRRNVQTWSRDPLPRHGERRTYGQDPLVFQHYAGRGMQLHPLGSFGRANALTGACAAERRARDRHARREAARAVMLRHVGEPFPRGAVRLRGPRCRGRALTRLLDRLVAVSSRRRGFRAWEYQFAYGGGRPLWVSGMAQATAVQALARGSAALGRPDWMRAAHEALGAFELPPPLGIRVPSGRGVHYLMYSFAPDLRILNGFLQAVSGLHDMAELSASPRARRLYEAGERAAREAVAVYDTGAWSLYSAGGAEATLNYHVLVRDLAGGLCRRTSRRAWCDSARRFARYVAEPPGLVLAAPRSARAGRAAGIVVVVDRDVTVSLRITGAGTRSERRAELPRGRHVLPWRPARRGRYRLAVTAVSRSARRAERVSRVVVAPGLRTRRPERAAGDAAGGTPSGRGAGRDERRRAKPDAGQRPRRAKPDAGGEARRPRRPGAGERTRRRAKPDAGGNARQRPAPDPGGAVDQVPDGTPEPSAGAPEPAGAPDAPSVRAGGGSRSGE